MGVTFKEMMSPTLTEDYPDAPAQFQERFRGVHELQRDENGLEKCVACAFCVPPLVLPTAFISKQRRIPTSSASVAASAMPRSTTSITTVASSVAFLAVACPTDAITHGHGFEIASYNTSTLIYRKEQMLVQIPPGAHFPLKADTSNSPGGGH